MSELKKISKILSRKGLYSFLKKEYEKINPDSKVLSIGSGGDINCLLSHYSKNKFKVTSMDIDNNRNPDIVGDICQFDFGSQKFDFILLSEVLEHLYNPQSALRNIHKILVPGGKVILTVPFIFPIHDRPHDYYRYTKFGLKYLLKDFNDVTIQERNTWAETINILILRLIMEKSRGARIFSHLYFIFGFTLYPLFYILGYLIKTDYITTGYNVVAMKSEKDI